MTTIQKTAVRTYFHQEQEILLITDGQTCWDATEAITMVSIMFLMRDCQRDNAPNWPLPSTPWENHLQELKDGDLQLLAEAANPDDSQRSFTLYDNLLEQYKLEYCLTEKPGATHNGRWKNTIIEHNKFYSINQHVHDHPAPDDPPHNPAGDTSPYGTITSATAEAAGVWKIDTNQGQSGLMLDQRLWNSLPAGVRAPMLHPGYAVGESEFPIMATILDLDTPQIFNEAIDATKNNPRYRPALKYLMMSNDSCTHYHASTIGQKRSRGSIGTFKLYEHAAEFVHNPANTLKYGELTFYQCALDDISLHICPP